MTTHLRTRAAQAGAFLALIVGGVATAPAAALAQQPNVSIDNLSPTDVSTGGSVTMQYTVTNTNGADVLPNQAIIRVSGMSCNGDCSQLIKIDPGNSKSFTAKLTAPTVAAGETQSVTVSVSATINGETSNDSQTVTVRGADKPQTVRQISGKVKDQDGKAISGAAVGLRDSSGHAYGTTTNGSGAYSFTSSDSQPIVPGNITVAAGKDGFDEAKVDVQAAAGRTVNVPLTLKLAVSASTSPSASASASVSASPTEQVTDAGTTGAGALPADTGTAGTKKTGQNGGSGSMLYIIIGGLLVAAGVGAIVLVMMRRKNNGEDDDGPDGGSGSGGVVPPSQGRFNDATRVATPVGAATMMTPRSAAPSISDAPTMLQQPVQPVVDEFPDPYGAAVPQQGGYAAAGGWDAQGGNYGGGTYGGATQYGQPQQEEQYGAYAAGYPAENNYGGGQQRYDEPTGMYRPESEQDGYGGYEQAGGYGTGAVPGAAAPPAGPQYGGGYGGQEADYQVGGYPAGNYVQEPADQGGYGSWGAPAGGIDSGNAYGPQSAGAYGGGAYGGGAAPADGYGGADQQQYGGGYEEDPHGGYDDRGGYGPGGGYAGGYDQAGGGRAPQGGAGQGGPGQGGYDRYADDPDGYGQRGGYEEQPSRHGGQPAHPGPRRPVEWDS